MQPFNVKLFKPKRELSIIIIINNQILDICVSGSKHALAFFDQERCFGANSEEWRLSIGVVLPSPDVICLLNTVLPLSKTIFEFRKSSQNTDKQFVLEGHF